MEKIINNLKKGVVMPCYLLYGEEEYLIKEALNKILDIIIPEADRDFGLFYLDGENTDMDSLIDNVLTPSLLGTRKVVVVKDTSIFTPPDLDKLIEKIRTNLDQNPNRAKNSFKNFLRITGFSLEDLQGVRWQKITDEQWDEIVGRNNGEDRKSWLPGILKICQDSGLTDASVVDETEKLEEILKKGLPAGSCLIFTAESVDRRKKIYKIIADAGVVKEFVKVKQEGARKEILQKEAQKLLNDCGKKMSLDAWDSLGRKTGFDFRRSISELEKLISFVGDKALINENDVEEVVGRTKEDEIFALTNALGEKNQLKALEALKNLMDQGIHHLIILSMITREIRLMLQARLLVDSGKMPKFNHNMKQDWFYRVLYPAFSELSTLAVKGEGVIFGQKPYPVYKAMCNCVLFTSDRLIILMEDLLNIERAYKASGTSNHKLLLENFLIKSCA